MKHGNAAIAPLIDVMTDGDGYAPVHACRLLGELRACEAIVPMLHGLFETEWDDLLHDAIIQALPKIGPPVLELVLECWDEHDDLDLRFSLAGVLAGCGARDERIFERLIEQFENDPDGTAMYLAEYGDPRAIESLSQVFDAYDVVETEGPLRHEILIELRAAIEELGGTLTPQQLQKYDAAMEPVHRWRQAMAAVKRAPSRRERPGRNEPCWCGSTKKYKKCHLDSDDANVGAQS